MALNNDQLAEIIAGIAIAQAAVIRTLESQCNLQGLGMKMMSHLGSPPKQLTLQQLPVQALRNALINQGSLKAEQTSRISDFLQQSSTE